MCSTSYKKPIVLQRKISSVHRKCTDGKKVFNQNLIVLIQDQNNEYLINLYYCLAWAFEIFLYVFL